MNTTTKSIHITSESWMSDCVTDNCELKPGKSTNKATVKRNEMKIYTIIFLLVLTFVYTTVNRKIKNNQVIKFSEAIKIIQATTKKLAFEESNSSTAKLDQSWSNVSAHSFDLVEETAKAFIIKGYNTKNQQTLYFIIDKHGHVREVMAAEYFSAYSKSLKSI